MGLELTKVVSGDAVPNLDVTVSQGNDGLALAAAQLREEFEMRMEIQKGRMWLQDLWFLTYLLVDDTQRGTKTEANGIERPKYYTPKAMSIVDTARRVLARNPLRYRVVEPHTGNTREDREDVRVLENVYHGLMFDLDRQLVRRGESSARMAAAFHSLVRGQWAFKLHLTSQGQTSTGSPAHYQSLDPRLVLPGFDMNGMSSAISWNLVTLSQLYYEYEDKIRPLVENIVRANRNFGGKIDYSFLHHPLLQLEWSSPGEHGLMLDISGISSEYLNKFGVNDHEHADKRYLWLREPWETGLDDSIIKVGNVNGVPAGLASQEAATMFTQFSTGLVPVASNDGSGTTITGQRVPPQMPNTGSTSSLTHSTTMIDPVGAMVGRSILAPVAHLFPQFNELMVLLKQGVQNEVRGTWTFKSRGGGMQELRLGDGSINPLQLNEQLENVQPNIAAIDVQQVMAQVQQDISEGSLDLRFVLGSDFEGSGFLRQRMEQGALTALTDYEHGMENWGVSVAEVFNKQYAKAKGKFDNWKLYGRQPGASTQFFVIDIDDQIKEKLTNTEEPPVITAKTKVEVPIDMAARINTAKTAVDPNNPVLSLIQAIDLILELDDADQAYDNILQDIGHRNPTLQLVTIADAFRRAGANELADMILGDQFRDSFANATQQGSTLTNAGAAKGTDPSAAPVEVTTGDGSAGLPPQGA